jgi:hypothetical protein
MTADHGEIEKKRLQSALTDVLRFEMTWSSLEGKDRSC